MVCGPGDNRERVMTVVFKDEISLTCEGVTSFPLHHLHPDFPPPGPTSLWLILIS